MQKSFFVRWCARYWLYAVYALGIAMLAVTVVFFEGMDVHRRMLCILAVLLPLHVFEENTWPDGFHYMLNLVQKSKQPNVGPMNRLSDMISNLGAEILVIALAVYGGSVATSIFVAFFGIGEVVAHTLFGIITRRRLSDGGMKNIYGPGLATAYLTLLPLSVYAIIALSAMTITVYDAIGGVLIIACIIVGLIRLPIMLLGKYQPQYAFENAGYFDRFL